jgi:hypothetical protein
MALVKRWSVDIYIDEHPDERRTFAEARLHSGDPTNVRGIGTSRRNPQDMEVPEIGDELAAARALEDLAVRLRSVAAGDIEALSDEASHGW